MTGFGKVTAELPSKKVTVEIKALNSKQLDLSTRIPSIYKDKEMELRSLLLQSLERGKVEFNIFIEYIGKDTPTQINLAAVENYYNQIKEIAEKLNISVPNDWFQTLLRMPDAIKSETVEPDESEWGVVLETILVIVLLGYLLQVIHDTSFDFLDTFPLVFLHFFQQSGDIGYLLLKKLLKHGSFLDTEITQVLDSVLYRF